jgi:hypothetical protein
VAEKRKHKLNSSPKKGRRNLLILVSVKFLPYDFHTHTSFLILQFVMFRHYFFKNALNKSIGSGRNVVVVFVGHFAHRLKIRE